MQECPKNEFIIGERLNLDREFGPGSFDPERRGTGVSGTGSSHFNIFAEIWHRCWVS
jgi:hypothetical protein